MNCKKNIIWNLWLGCGAGLALAACTSDEIIPSSVDGGRMEIVGKNICALYNPAGAAGATLELRTEPVTGEVRVVLSAAAGQAVDLKLVYDETLLEEYNEANATDFDAVPASAVRLEADGALLVGPQTTLSDPLQVRVDPSDDMAVGTTYGLPLRLTSGTDGVGISESEDSCIFWVKVLGERPSTQKDTGMITVCYVEVNGNNPLNALEWSCKRNDKPLFDIVNLFAANINWIEEEGRVGVVLNPNVQHILANRDKYIQPLQDAGMRVSLTILGNGDGTGVANLSDEAARLFAEELRAIVESYGLDGVDFDDEYSSYSQFPIRPGCVEYGAAPYARLLYEVKRLMPDKLVTVYQIGQAMGRDGKGFNMMIDGVRPGDFIDYAYTDYGALYDVLHLGMTRSQWGVGSLDMTYEGESNPENIQYNRREGYGLQMVYNLKAGNGQKTPLGDVAKYIYDDEVVWSGKSHAKDW